MICLINSLSRNICLLALGIIFITGCARHVVDEKEPLAVKILSVAQEGRQVTRVASIHMRALATGGEGSVTYTFSTIKDGVETVEQSGEESSCFWTPKESGTYILKVAAEDGAGTVVERRWENEYVFGTPVDSASIFAVFPIDNLSGAKAPLKEMLSVFREALSAKGIRLLDNETLEEFMKKYRVRYTGGLNSEISKKLHDELGVEGVFITSLETWQDVVPPRVSLISRLVLSGDLPQILWIDSVGFTGDDTPGLFGIGRIRSSDKLLANAFDSLISSFQAYLDGDNPSYRSSKGQHSIAIVNNESKTADSSGPGLKRFHFPQFTFRAKDFEPQGKYTVAVIPFLNINARKNAGEIVALHFVKELQRYENLLVFEPGLVRETLLNYRMIMEAGPSLASSDILANESILGADLVLSGKVFDYQGEVGKSKVDFSVQTFDGEKREIVWTSRSYATGDAGVYFFGQGRINTAHGLTSRMSKAVVTLFLQ